MGGRAGRRLGAGSAGRHPGSLRQRALAQIVERYDAVVLVDSDDVLHPTRVATARAMLAGGHDFAGCALRLVDERGGESGHDVRAAPGRRPRRPSSLAPTSSACRTPRSAPDCCRRCLPIPAAAVLVDWYLATRAWLFGARLAFGDRVEMDYRQHGANMARVRGPFPAAQVAEDTERVAAALPAGPRIRPDGRAARAPRGP